MVPTQASQREAPGKATAFIAVEYKLINKSGFSPGASPILDPGGTYGLEERRHVPPIPFCHHGKFAEHMAGRVGNRRSCRTPLVENIEADFKGDNAKLIWPVSLDGRKMQSETYKILAIMDKPAANP